MPKKLGAGEVRPKQHQRFTDVFEECFPVYLAFGMTYELFWEAPAEVAVAFRKADEIKRKRLNQELWLSGLYVREALVATVGNMFSKGMKHEYPSEPLALTEAEQQERREREQKARMERIKASFTARALSVNAKMGGVEK